MKERSKMQGMGGPRFHPPLRGLWATWGRRFSLKDPDSLVTCGFHLVEAVRCSYPGHPQGRSRELRALAPAQVQNRAARRASSRARERCAHVTGRGAAPERYGRGSRRARPGA
jgi:hypothetical protein